MYGSEKKNTKGHLIQEVGYWKTRSLGIMLLALLGFATARTAMAQTSPFAIPPATLAQPHTITILANFNDTNGASPRAGLTLSGSTLYGTTLEGGMYDRGTVFDLTPIPTAIGKVNATKGARTRSENTEREHREKPVHKG